MFVLWPFRAATDWETGCACFFSGLRLKSVSDFYFICSQDLRRKTRRCNEQVHRARVAAFMIFLLFVLYPFRVATDWETGCACSFFQGCVWNPSAISTLRVVRICGEEPGGWVTSFDYLLILWRFWTFWWFLVIWAIVDVLWWSLMFLMTFDVVFQWFFFWYCCGWCVAMLEDLLMVCDDCLMLFDD